MASKKFSMGQGQYMYSVDVDWWGPLPEGMELGYTHGIVVDSRDHVYVFHTGSPSILEYDPSLPSRKLPFFDPDSVTVTKSPRHRPGFPSKLRFKACHALTGHSA